MNQPHRFPIGTVYTVVDQLTLTNAVGEVVRTFYASEHDFCGQKVRVHDVVDPTIARGFVSRPEA